jgi:hypothetical protein
MKKISIVVALIVSLTTLISCKSGKSGCDAYGKVETTKVSDQASK